tara:strand:+ start:4205 stop:4360 length:156 start_codon:yes stop_codon:yes gene_type:complete
MEDAEQENPMGGPLLAVAALLRAAIGSWGGLSRCVTQGEGEVVVKRGYWSG